MQCHILHYYSLLPLISNSDVGEPLFLTPLINQHKIQEARNSARVSLNNIESYAGFLTVNSNYDSNLFFWFFPSQTDHFNDPLILWLQGGPGASSLLGLFTINGPLVINSKNRLETNENSWTKNHSVIYIDNPVGTGFSFTKGGFVQNQTIIGQHLYEALTQFYQLFPELQKNPFYVTGESYAGKYVPALAYTIHKNNFKAKIKINLQGLAMGNAYCDPLHQSDYSDFLYQIGLIDSNLKEAFQQAEREGIEAIKNQNWLEAYKIFDDLIGGDSNGGNTLFKNATGFEGYLNFLNWNEDSSSVMEIENFVQTSHVRLALHVGTLPFSVMTKEVEVNLQEDIMKSVAPWVSELLSHYKVLVYNGQLDIIVAYPLTVNFLENLNFDSAHLYKIAPRYQWYVDGQLSGYVKEAGNLTEVLIRNAGHMAPKDQPIALLDLITSFTRNKRPHRKP